MRSPHCFLMLWDDYTIFSQKTTEPACRKSLFGRLENSVQGRRGGAPTPRRGLGSPVPGWRHVGMPPYGVRRGRNGNRRPGRAADSRPYGVRSARPVGRGAHTPPKQAAETKESASIAARAWRHVGMPPYAQSGDRTALHTEPCGPMWASAPTNREPSNPGSVRLYGCPGQRD